MNETAQSQGPDRILTPAMTGPNPELADIFRQHVAAYRQTLALPLHQHRLMQAIENCRTAALGGAAEYCDHCQNTRIVYRSWLRQPQNPANPAVSVPDGVLLGSAWADPPGSRERQ